MLSSENNKWWLVRCGQKEGYASKYYFSPLAAENDYKVEPYYFGKMPREEAEDLLADPANPDGAFLLRHTKARGGAEVLTLKYYEPSAYEFKYKNYNVKTDGKNFYFTRRVMCSSVLEQMDL